HRGNTAEFDPLRWIGRNTKNDISNGISTAMAGYTLLIPPRAEEYIKENDSAQAMRNKVEAVTWSIWSIWSMLLQPLGYLVFNDLYHSGSDITAKIESGVAC